MPHPHPLDVVLIGAGPNGLAAAITLARVGWSVRVIEAAATVGGGTRTAELTLPGFRHDVCSAVHPLALSSAFFRDLPLERYGLQWIHPPLPLAHPLDDGTAVALERSVEATAAGRAGCTLPTSPPSIPTSSPPSSAGSSSAATITRSACRWPS